MEKIIWVICDNKRELVEASRAINSTGGMNVSCIASNNNLKKQLEGMQLGIPSLILIDYDTSLREEHVSLNMIKQDSRLYIVPIFFMVSEKNHELDDICYDLGATVIIKKPISERSVKRIERMAWQFNIMHNAEKKIESQATELKLARKIKELNEQLLARNELLYKVFGRYFSDEVLSRIIDEPDGASIGGQKKELTVMMSDLRGFTALSQKISSDELMDLLNYYYGKMVDVISQYNGTIIEFLGDGILAVFGAPIDDTNHTDSAIAAAIAMQNCMNEVNTFCDEFGYDRLNMGIGLHRGETFIGNVGSEKVMRYNVIGNVVNECSRIESYSVGGQVFISLDALSKVESTVESEGRIEIKAKGLSKPIIATTIKGIRGLYNNSLSVNENEHLKDKNINNILVRTIRDKHISDEGILLDSVAMGKSRMILANQMTGDIKLYEDVIISFDNIDIYAKITKIDEKEIVATITHCDADYKEYIDRI